MILYIHGFASSGLSTKAQLFRKHYRGKEAFIAPSLSYIPDLALATLEEMVLNLYPQEQLYLIGSSLGGFYAMYLSQKYNLPAVLINPASNPIALSKELEGTVQSYYDESTFTWTAEHTKALEDIQSQFEPTFDNCLAFVKKGDAVVPYEDAVAHLPGADIVIEEGGDHGFEEILVHKKRITIFFKSFTAQLKTR